MHSCNPAFVAWRKLPFWRVSTQNRFLRARGRSVASCAFRAQIKNKSHFQTSAITTWWWRFSRWFFLTRRCSLCRLPMPSDGTSAGPASPVRLKARAEWRLRRFREARAPSARSCAKVRKLENSYSGISGIYILVNAFLLWKIIVV